LAETIEFMMNELPDFDKTHWRRYGRKCHAGGRTRFERGCLISLMD
jgi:hypothetical protein